LTFNGLHGVISQKIFSDFEIRRTGVLRNVRVYKITFETQFCDAVNSTSQAQGVVTTYTSRYIPPASVVVTAIILQEKNRLFVAQGMIAFLVSDYKAER
jgi:hypothetical protein